MFEWFRLPYTDAIHFIEKKGIHTALLLYRFAHKPPSGEHFQSAKLHPEQGLPES